MSFSLKRRYRERSRSPMRRSAIPSIRRNPFTSLPREIRSMIYDYMTFPPLEADSDVQWAGSAGHLALTCRQAMSEWREECARRFWIYLKKIENKYRSLTGFELRFPGELASKDDMIDVQSLKAVIRRPFPIDPWHSAYFVELIYLPLDELVLHYTGTPDTAPDFDTGIKGVLNLIEDDLSRYTAGDPRTRPRCITVSWDYRETKRDRIWLAGHMIVSTRKTRRIIEGHTSVAGPLRLKGLPERVKERGRKSWSFMKTASSANMEVGFVRLSLGSNHLAPIEDRLTLLDAFDRHFFLDQSPKMAALQSNKEYKVYDIQVEFAADPE